MQKRSLQITSINSIPENYRKYFFQEITELISICKKKSEFNEFYYLDLFLINRFDRFHREENASFDIREDNYKEFFVVYEIDENSEDSLEYKLENVKVLCLLKLSRNWLHCNALYFDFLFTNMLDEEQTRELILLMINEAKARINAGGVRLHLKTLIKNRNNSLERIDVNFQSLQNLHKQLSQCSFSHVMKTYQFYVPVRDFEKDLSIEKFLELKEHFHIYSISSLSQNIQRKLATYCGEYYKSSHEFNPIVETNLDEFWFSEYFEDNPYLKNSYIFLKREEWSVTKNKFERLEDEGLDYFKENVSLVYLSAGFKDGSVYLGFTLWSKRLIESFSYSSLNEERDLSVKQKKSDSTASLDLNKIKKGMIYYSLGSLILDMELIDKNFSNKRNSVSKNLVSQSSLENKLIGTAADIKKKTINSAREVELEIDDLSPLAMELITNKLVPFKKDQLEIFWSTYQLYFD